MWLYDTLIWTVMGYGAEVWGWRKKGGRGDSREVYKVDYEIRLKKVTPGYMVREETDRWMMRSRAGRRA